MGLIEVQNFKWNHSGKTTNTHWKHTLKFTVPGERFVVEFVVIKHFTWESLHVEPSYGLDIVVYMLKCVFC